MSSKNFAGKALMLGCVFFVTLISTARAQVANVTIEGVVKDQSGAVVPSGSVTATNTQTGLQKAGTTDQDGRYSILGVPPGVYNVQASAQGFATTEQRSRELLVGTTVTIDFALQLSSVTQTVEVTGETTAIDTTQTVVAKVIEPDTLDNLPTISRSFSDLAALSPGVLVSTTASATNGAQAISVGAGTSYQTGYIVDGVITQNSRTNGQILNFAQDWIQEFSLVSQMPPAEFGSASGGFVNAITRSGGNQIHGRIYGYFQNSALNAKPAFATTNPQANLRRVGGMVGGPIKKDKLFYFFGYENWYNNQSIAVVIPTLFLNPAIGITSGTFPQISKTQIGIGKLNYNLNAKHSVWARWNYEYDNNTNVGLATNISPGSASHAWSPVDIYAGAWDWTKSASTLNEVRGNFNRNMLNQMANCKQYLGNYTGPNAGAFGAGAPLGYWSNVSYPQAGGVLNRCVVSGGAEGVSETHIDEMVVHSTGNHAMKFGGEVHVYALNTQTNYRNQADPVVTVNGTTTNIPGPFTFNLATSTPPTLCVAVGPGCASVGDLNSTKPGNLPVSYNVKYQTGQKSYFQAFAYNWYIQDSWRKNDSLTLNIGIRYDIDRGGIGLNQLVPVNSGHNHFHGIYNAVAPRFGFAWTPTKSKNTVVRGGVGVFWDKNTFNIYGAWKSAVFESIQNFNLTASRPTQNPYCFGNNSCANGVVPGIYQEYVQFELAKALSKFALPAFPGVTGGVPNPPDIVTIGTTTLAIPAATFTLGGQAFPSPVGASSDIDPNYKFPGNLQAAGGIAHQFKQFNVSADFNYVYGWYQYIVDDYNVNPIVQSNPAITLPINPAYQTNLVWNNGGFMKDYSLRILATYRDHRGDMANVAYSLGWAYDDTITSFAAGTSAAATNPFNALTDYGPSANDARHILNASGTIHIPFGISFSPIAQVNSGLPYTATTTAAVVAGCPSYYSTCYPVGYTKNSLRGGTTVMLNGRLSKQINLGESRSVTVLAEVYNALNKDNFGTRYVTNVGASNFRSPNGVTTPKRQFQLGFRFDF